jgi:hypothetical protein
LLRALDALPESRGEAEPWFTLWSALAHQGDVYPASFAAVPHVVRALAANPLRAGGVYFQFPAWVESCRRRKLVDIPEDLRAPYASALRELPALVAAASAREWDSGFVRCALCAVAAAKGHIDVAEVVLELDPNVSREFMEWYGSR